MLIASESDLETVKVLICGDSGSGKTTFASTAPRSLYVAFERQARIVVKRSQKRTGVGSCAKILHPECAQDLRDIVKAFHGPRDEPFRIVDPQGRTVLELEDWPLTLVIDSVTDAVKVIQEEIDSVNPLRTAKDGFNERSIRRRGAYREECEKMFRGVRDVPAHVIWLAILDEGVDEASDGTAFRYAGPRLLAKTHRAALMQTTNVAGIARRRVIAPKFDDNGRETEPARVEYGIQLLGPSHLPLKEFPPLEAFEKPNFSDWLTRITG